MDTKREVIITNTLHHYFTNKNLQHACFANEDLSHFHFSDSDLRGADFSSADLSGAVFTNVKVGIPPLYTALIFVIGLLMSVLCGYIIMIAGQNIQIMFAATDPKIKASSIITLLLIALFIIMSIWKGLGNSISDIVLPVCAAACVIALSAYLSGKGAGVGMLYLAFTLMLIVLMYIVATVGRVAVGVMSNVLFVAVALAGTVFSKSIGGCVGATIIGISCAVISKRALSGEENFGLLRSVVAFIIARFGTSFRNSKLTSARFSRSIIRNADFSNADISFLYWDDCEKINCKE
jgi:hypothetical protein